MKYNQGQAHINNQEIIGLTKLLSIFIEIDESQRKDKKNETRS